jgi:hypothetical protein
MEAEYIACSTTTSTMVWIKWFVDILKLGIPSRPSNFRSFSCVPLKIRWLLELPFYQNSILINHKLNGNLKSYIIFEVTEDGLLTLL